MGDACGNDGHWLTLGRLRLGTDRRATGPVRPPGAGEMIAVTFHAADATAALTDGESAAVRDAAFVLLAPRTILRAAGPERATNETIAAGPALARLRHLLAGLIAARPDGLAPVQLRMIERAVAQLLSAARSSAAAATGGLGQRRQATLLDRLIAAIDANLDGDLSVERLCADLSCSRSALYRATATVGGVAELVLARRLIAVRAALSDPADTRSVAAIAQRHGFADAAGFNRRFRHRFGVSPGAARARGTLAAARGAD